MSQPLEAKPVILEPYTTNIINPGQRFTVRPQFLLPHEMGYPDYTLTEYPLIIPDFGRGELKFFRMNLHDDTIEAVQAEDKKNPKLDTFRRQIIQVPPDYRFRGDTTNSGIIEFIRSLPVYAPITFLDLTYEQITRLKVQMVYQNKLVYNGIIAFEQELLQTQDTTAATCDWYERTIDTREEYGRALIDPEVIPTIHWTINV